ncbi:hypothetical protein [Stackebrandtia nassauensis]|uniref:Extracellular repeat protein, HAF family n=1 Tax=Stackebrandtia nassauensis (strain DSM 44728 / CIP 108903 / NRRL B-16338 / NBRC 102104 / LLR-40K-21) TaxID=446470 RepID=D3PWJ6_STANL|nr:hypothetical protein [Stackebrandtia nassauensis]ADD43218.1 hypothetical protein Snas_3556 [Stackebrandtia nassauensis DSM 44728]
MKARRKLTLLALAAGSVALAVPTTSVLADAEDTSPDSGCEVETLPTPEGYKAVVATDVSGSGDHIVGMTRRGDDGRAVPVIWRDGKVQTIDELDTHDTWPKGVNDAGQVIGNHDSSYGTVPWVYHDGKITDLKVGKGQSAFAYDINNSGQIVGFIFEEDGDAPKRAVLWKSVDSDPVTLPVFDEKAEARGTGIDEDGTVTGIQAAPDDKTTRIWAWDPNGGKGRELTRPVIDNPEEHPMTTEVRGGHVISLDDRGVPGYQWDLSDLKEGTEIDIAHPMNVNPDGTIVGITKDNNAAMLTSQGVTELPNASAPSNETGDNVAAAISDSGDIAVGNGVSRNGDKELYIAAKWTCG